MEMRYFCEIVYKVQSYLILFVCISTMMMDTGFLKDVNHPLLHCHLILQIHLLYFLITVNQMLLPVLHIKKEFQVNGSHLLGILLMKKIVLKHLLYEPKT